MEDECSPTARDFLALPPAGTCDVPLAQVKALRFPLLPSRGAAEAALYCAPHFSPAHPSAPRRALNPSEHILIVRVLRARRAPGRSPHPSEAARCASRRTARLSFLLSKLLCPSLLEGDLFGLPLRASFSPAHPLARRDVPLARASAYLRPRVARVEETNRHPLYPIRTTS